MRIRPAIESDLDRLLNCDIDPHLSGVDAAKLRATLTSGHYRWDHIWIAEHAGQPLARAIWWAPPHSDHPLALDCLWVADSVADRADIAVRLLTAAHGRFAELGAAEPPGCHTFLPVGWQDDPAVSRAVRWRYEVLSRVGLTDRLERLRWRWDPSIGTAAPDHRVRFAPADDAAFLAAFREVSGGSLDIATAKGIRRHGVDEEARQHMDVYLSMPGPRDRWRLGYSPEGDLVGLAIPTANAGGPVVGYVGVVPRWRGRGLIDVMLAEITRSLAADGAETILADTDASNHPMIGAFERAGYINHSVRLVIDAPS